MSASATIHELQQAKAQNLPATAPLDVRRDTAVMPGFNSSSGWELAQRIGKAFAASTLVPAAYQGNLANCIVALEMANRMGASPLMALTAPQKQELAADLERVQSACFGAAAAMSEADLKSVAEKWLRLAR
jgi:hypothetical protein